MLFFTLGKAYIYFHPAILFPEQGKGHQGESFALNLAD